jgi:hypothetical protein
MKTPRIRSENADDKGWGAAVQGAVWNGVARKALRAVTGLPEKDVENEKIQPFLVAARRHSVVSSDRLQPELHDGRRGLWARYGRHDALRRHGFHRQSRQQRRRGHVFAVHAVFGCIVYAERGVRALVGDECGLSHAEYGLVHAAGARRHSLTT